MILLKAPRQVLLFTVSWRLVKQTGLIRKNISTTYSAACLTRNGRNETLRWWNIFPGLLKSRKNVNDKSHRIWIVSHIWSDGILTCFDYLPLTLFWGLPWADQWQDLPTASDIVEGRFRGKHHLYWATDTGRFPGVCTGEQSHRLSSPEKGFESIPPSPAEEKEAESKTLSWNCCATIPDSPSIDLRMSV